MSNVPVIRDIVYYVSDGIRETLIDDEIILLNETSGAYLGLNGSAKIVWSIIKEQRAITHSQLTEILLQEWTISEIEEAYVDEVLNQLSAYKVINYGEDKTIIK